MSNKTSEALNGKAEQVVGEASKSVHEVSRELHHHAENAKSDMVKMLNDAAKTLRKQAREADAPDEVQHSVDGVATGFEKAASYLKRNSYGEISDDAVHTVKKYPLQTMAIVLVIGVIIGLILRGSDSQ